MKISIVTAAFNAARTLPDTLESVARQTHTDIEHWLIDGASADATKDVVRRHGKHLSGFISRPDKGLYDAMNKGARQSQGEVLAFLNADDWYASPEVLAKVAREFETGADLVYGDLAFVSTHAPFSVSRVWRDSARDPLDFTRMGWHPAHPSTFMRRELFLRLGGFDLRWRIAADYAFMALAMQQRGLAIRHVPEVMVNMRLGGASTVNLRAVWRANRECVSALREMGAPHPRTTVALKLTRKLAQLQRWRLTQKAADLWRPWDP